jgi:sugar (pentulose or hexulose) kinase
MAIELAAAVTDLVGDTADVRLTGGFLRDEIWPQLVTDALGVITFVPEPEAATSTGAAVIGWLALGSSRSAVSAPAIARMPRRPNSSQHDVLADKAFRSTRVREALRVLSS